ncbi:hypothetical protein J437_LFUL015759 [Ladona fulva]|uniref:Brinker DNA-binding domain-containing protein n=1 Tax=Ladona fulva TaxID=123851 RepID=A0A8K0KLN4_LADFU|nr:hypothetical protein J437_LFUL015759 [Ladona fulva]
MSDSKFRKQQIDLNRQRTDSVQSGQVFRWWLCICPHTLPAGDSVFAADSAWEEKWGKLAETDGAKTAVALGVGKGQGACSDVFFGGRRMFSANFKLRVLDSYRQDPDCKGNQRATARKYGIHRRQIQKWLQVESCLRTAVKGQGEMALDLVVRGKGAAEAPVKNEPPEEEEEEGEINSPTVKSPTVGIPDPSVWVKQEPQEIASTTPSRLPSFSKRRSFSLQFKLGVLDAFHAGCGNQRATARLFGINRRQVQKWLRQEARLRSEASVAAVAAERQRLGKWAAEEEDGGGKPPAAGWEPPLNIPVVRRPWADEDDEEPEVKRLRWDCTVEQETALCLVKSERRTDEFPEVLSAPKERKLPPAPHRVPLAPHRVPPPLLLPTSYDELLGICNSAVSLRLQQNGKEISSSSSAASSPDPSYFPCLPPSPPGSRRRQCYHLDFKLKAIEEYHEGDGEWRGNQRAVAKRFGVHRRQIQKWLKQEEQLRQRAAGSTSGTGC